MKTIASVVLDVTGIAVAAYLVYPLYENFNAATSVILAALQMVR